MNSKTEWAKTDTSVLESSRARQVCAGVSLCKNAIARKGHFCFADVVEMLWEDLTFSFPLVSFGQTPEAFGATLPTRPL